LQTSVLDSDDLVLNVKLTEEEPVTTNIKFYSTAGGSIAVEGETKNPVEYSDVAAGTTVAVPEVSSFTGYEFKGWRKGSAS